MTNTLNTLVSELSEETKDLLLTMSADMLSLAMAMTQNDIPFEMRKHPCGVGYQLCYPSIQNRLCSVVSTPYSYGGEHGLLEIMGLLTPEEKECDEVAGWLTANDVYFRIYADFKGLDPQWVRSIVMSKDDPEDEADEA